LRRRLAVTSIFFCLASCSTSPPEVIRYPASDISARLRFSVSDAGATSVLLSRLDVQSCPASISGKLLAVAGTRVAVPESSSVDMYGSSGKAEALIREMYIPADEPFVFNAWALRDSRPNQHHVCETGGVFVPRRGRQYELDLVIDAGTFLCVARVNELRPPKEGRVVAEPEPSARFFITPRRTDAFCDQVTRWHASQSIRESK
jgi:hypothetical protein